LWTRIGKTKLPAPSIRRLVLFGGQFVHFSDRPALVAADCPVPPPHGLLTVEPAFQLVLNLLASFSSEEA